jgi:hypothetical protein
MRGLQSFKFRKYFAKYVTWDGRNLWERLRIYDSFLLFDDSANEYKNQCILLNSFAMVALKDFYIFYIVDFECTIVF